MSAWLLMGALIMASLPATWSTVGVLLKPNSFARSDWIGYAVVSGIAEGVEAKEDREEELLGDGTAIDSTLTA
jgi:hypothetical protein